MPPSTSKRLTTSTGNIYAYIHVPAQADRRTLLLIHGFPSHSADWQCQIEHFSRQGYGIIAPDLLGFGESSKPDNARLYRLRAISDDLIELLDHLSVRQVVGVGHDIGAAILSRLAAYHAVRFSALAFLAVGPPKLGTPFDVQTINATTKEMLGFELLGYIDWIGSSPDDAEDTLEQHPESAMSLLFASDENVWNEWFRPLNKMKQFVSSDRRVEIGVWYPEELRQKHLHAFGRPEGYKGAVRWYQMWKENLFAPDEVGWEETQLKQPTLLLVPKGQGGEQQKQLLAEWAPELRTVEVESGHWVQLEARKEVNRAIGDLLASV